MRKKKKNNDQHLLTHTDPHSPVAEAYRTLRTNIQFASLDKAAKSLLITGANPAAAKAPPWPTWAWSGPGRVNGAYCGYRPATAFPAQIF